MQLIAQALTDYREEVQRLPKNPTISDNRHLIEFFAYKALASEGCYAKAEKLSEHLLSSNLPEDLREQIHKVQKTIRPFLELCREGNERIEKSKNDPKEGPRPIHWLAIYLNDLNEAAALQDREGAKRAIANLLYVGGNIEQYTSIPQNLKTLHEQCINRINEIDPNESLRYELTWTGRLINEAKPCAILAGGLGLMFASHYAHMKIHETAMSFFGSEISLAISMSLFAKGAYQSIKMGSAFGTFLSSYLLYQQLSKQNVG